MKQIKQMCIRVGLTMWQDISIKAIEKGISKEELVRQCVDFFLNHEKKK